MSEFPRIAASERARTLEALESGRFDCLVIGGGITGAGVARDAALRGLSVALLEADDFASGTSGRSSKLIHGGLRYLSMGEVALVRETALERKRLRAIAPHLAEPVWMVVPTRWAVECEGAATVEDVLYRRTRAAIWEPQSRESLLEPVAWRMRQLLGWSEERAGQECRSTRARFAGELGFLEGQPES